MNSKTKRPTKAQLLKDLESIHASLVASGKKHAALTAKSRATGRAIVSNQDENKTEEIENDEIPTLVNTVSDNDIESNEPTEQITTPSGNIQDTMSKAAPKVLPGQQSLFEDSHYDLPETKNMENDSENAKEEDTAMPSKANKTSDTNSASKSNTETERDLDLFANTSDQVTSAAADLPQAKGENPFLPQHIRERLNQQRTEIVDDLAEVEETLHKADLLLSPNSTTTSSLKANAKNSNKDDSKNANSELIDELVAKFLPQIEAELRSRLEEHVTKQKASLLETNS